MTFIPNQSNLVEISKDELLAFREKTVGEIFAESVGSDWRLVMPYKGVVLYCFITDAEKSEIGLVNTPFWLNDIRIISHDFASDSDWENGDSTFKIQPDAGKRYLVSDIFLSFDKNAVFGSANTPCLDVYKFIQGLGLICVKHVEFANMRELIDMSEAVQILSSVPGAYIGSVAYLRFRYADAHRFDGAPIILSGNTGEYASAYIKNHTILKNDQSTALSDACRVVFVGKESFDWVNYGE